MSEPPPGSARRAVLCVFAAQLVLLVLAAWRNGHQLNTDAVAYLRLAHYFATGQTELGVSGYWSPLLVWLLVPGLKLGLDPLVAARAVMVFSAVVFFWGGLAVFRVFNLAARETLLGACVLAASSVAWSVRTISPDLLVAGLLSFAVAALIEERWLADQRCAALAGCWWGLAYLAKAVALPLAVIIGVPLAWLVGSAAGDRRQAFRQLGVTLAAAFVVGMPWILTISFKYQTATFSTTARIAHAVAGPADVDRYHPFARTFHQPEPGRVTAWEDPSRMPYRYWSPFDSGDHFRHQLGVMAGNLRTELAMIGGVDAGGLAELASRPGALNVARALGGMDALWVGLLALGVCVWTPLRRGGAFIGERWRWAAVPCIGMMAVYLPVFLMREDQRYFQGLLPFLWIATVGAAAWWSKRRGPDAARFASRLTSVCFASFVSVASLWGVASLKGLPNSASRAAMELATAMRAANLAGPVAGHALMQGGRAGLYTAWMLGEPWLGESAAATPGEFLNVGARFAIVMRGSALERAIESHAAFRDLDPILARSATGRPWLHAFEVLPPGAGARDVR